MRACHQRRQQCSSSFPAWRLWRAACHGGQLLALPSRQVRITPDHYILHCYAGATAQGETQSAADDCLRPAGDGDAAEPDALAAAADGGDADTSADASDSEAIELDLDDYELTDRGLDQVSRAMACVAAAWFVVLVLAEQAPTGSAVAPPAGTEVQRGCTRSARAEAYTSGEGQLHRRRRLAA